MFEGRFNGEESARRGRINGDCLSSGPPRGLLGPRGLER